MKGYKCKFKNQAPLYLNRMNNRMMKNNLMNRLVKTHMKKKQKRNKETKTIKIKKAWRKKKGKTVIKFKARQTEMKIMYLVKTIAGLIFDNK